MTPDELSAFYSKVSFSGMLSIYALKLSLEKSIAFDREHLATTIGTPPPDYFFGFLVACTSFGVVRYNNKEKIITVTYLDPLLSQTIYQKILEKSKNDEHRMKWLENVNEYFK